MAMKQYRNYSSSDTTNFLSEPGATGCIVSSVSFIGWSAPSGKEFVCWNSSRDGTGTTYQDGAEYPMNIDIYAIWGDPAVDYLTTDQELTSIANAIRTKGGTSSSLVYPTGFVSAIQAISTGTDVSDTTATASDVLSGKYFYTSSGTKTQGSISSKTSSDLTASGATVTAPAGYYASAASKSVASGTEGTPTATKGTVSNNSVSVTPSVTNSAGYISGGTKTGTAVTVSASELVSGTKTISSSGTTDVTNYANASVAAGSATTPATTITAQPSISIGNDGLITASNSKTQSVTPTVSAGYVSSGTAGTITVSGSNTQQMVTQAAQTITPTTTDQTIASGKYLTGTQTIKGDANLVAGNIKKDVTIFGVTGTHEGGGGVIISDTTDAAGGTVRTITTTSTPVMLQAKTNIDPTSSSQTITPDTGYDGLSSVQINAASGGGGTEYVIQCSGSPYQAEVYYDYSNSGLSSSDFVLDGHTCMWIETKTVMYVSVWQDAQDDDDFSVVIPSGTKMYITRVDNDGSMYASFVFGQNCSYGYMHLINDDVTNMIFILSGGDYSQGVKGGLVQTSSYSSNYGDPCFNMSSEITQTELHILKY